MQLNLKLSHKGLVLVAVPLVFELVLLGMLTYLLKQTEAEVSRQQHSQEVISTIDMLSKQFDDAAQSMAGYSISGSPVYKEQASKIPQAVRQLETKLDLLAGDDVHQKNIFGRLKTIADTGITVLVETNSGNAGTEVSVQQAGKNFRTFSDVAASLREESRQFKKDEEQIQIESPEMQARFKTNIEILLLAFLVVNVLVAVGLAGFFSRGISKRLNVLTDNSYRLAGQRPLNPLISGSDEIADLDRVFHEMAQSLGEAMRKERAILDNAVDVILSLDENLRFTQVSPACEQAWGFTPQELLGQRLLTMVVEQDRERTNATIQAAIAGDTTLNLENKLLKKDGTVFDVQWSGSWSKEDRTLFCVCHDATERKRLEQLKSEFVAMVTHDLRTPLTSLRMLLSSLQEGLYGDLSEKGKTRVTHMSNDIGRMVNLISELLDMEKLEAGKLRLDMQPCSVQAIIDQATEAVVNLCASKQINLEVSSKDIKINADSNRIVQVLINLLGNAIKFSPRGETISVTVKQDGDWLRFSVSDRGPGIPKTHKDKIFDRFEQIEIADVKLKGGTGLGLAICKAIVHEHGGTLGVDSEEGEGSTFWFRIPAMKVPVGEAQS